MKIIESRSNDFSSRSYSALQLGFESLHFYPMVKTEVVTLSSFLGSIGGIMGLLAGISVLSIVETFYFFGKLLAERMTIKPIRIHPNLFKTVVRRQIRANKNHALYQLTKYFGEFIKASDAHGVLYTTDKEQSSCGRIFWTLMVIGSIVFCSILIVDSINNGKLNPVIVGIDSKTWSSEEVSKKT